MYYNPRLIFPTQGSCLGTLQAQYRQPLALGGNQRPMFWGGDDGVAPISAHVGQWDNRPCVLVPLFGNVSSDLRKDLRRQPIDWPHHIAQGRDEPQNVLHTGLEAFDL